MMYSKEINYLHYRCELLGNSLETPNHSEKEKRGRIEFDNKSEGIWFDHCWCQWIFH